MKLIQSHALLEIVPKLFFWSFYFSKKIGNIFLLVLKNEKSYVGIEEAVQILSDYFK